MERANLVSQASISFVSVAVLTACSPKTDPFPLKRLELVVPGVQVAINSNGHGVFRIDDLSGHPQNGAFDLGDEGFGRLAQSLGPFKEYAIPTKTFLKDMDRVMRCPKGTPYWTDNGGITVHWVNGRQNVTYWVDYGCDRERRAGEYRRLRNIFAGLPVPDPIPLP